MAKYKNREVTILKELPHPNGDQVEIEHKDLNVGKEIVPRKDVTLSQEEMGEVLKAREANTASSEFKVELVEKKSTGEHKVQG